MNAQLLESVIQALNERAEEISSNEPHDWSKHRSHGLYLNTSWDFDTATWVDMEDTLYRKVYQLPGGKDLTNSQIVEAALMLDCDCYKNKNGMFFLR